MWVCGQLHAPPALSLGKTQHPLCRRLGGHQGRSGLIRKISLPQEYDPRTVQPVASIYTDWDIPAHKYDLCEVKFLLLPLVVEASSLWRCWKYVQISMAYLNPKCVGSLSLGGVVYRSRYSAEGNYAHAQYDIAEHYCHRNLCLILFPSTAEGWAYVFRIERSVKFIQPYLSSLTTSRGVPIVRHWIGSPFVR
jgi:hypothetical protein